MINASESFVSQHFIKKKDKMWAHRESLFGTFARSFGAEYVVSA